MKLQLIHTSNGLLVEATAPGEEIEFYDVSGEGGKASQIAFAPWNQHTYPIEGVDTAEYNPEDTDSFWYALQLVLTSARNQGIALPDHAAY